MSGLLGLVGRGSIGQAVLAVVLAFVFFAIAFKHQPFTNERLNFLKICSEAQLFGVLVLCLVIQAVEIGPVGLSAETINIDGYGVIMTVVAAVAVPIALGSIYLIGRDVRESRQLDDTDAAADDTVEETRPTDLTPETFEQDFAVAASASRSAPARPIPARPTAQQQQVRRCALHLFCDRILSPATILLCCHVLNLMSFARLRSQTGPSSTARNTAAPIGKI
jgi:hypothetical protein